MISEFRPGSQSVDQMKFFSAGTYPYLQQYLRFPLMFPLLFWRFQSVQLADPRPVFFFACMRLLLTTKRSSSAELRVFSAGDWSSNLVPRSIEGVTPATGVPSHVCFKSDKLDSTIHMHAVSDAPCVNTPPSPYPVVKRPAAK